MISFVHLIQTHTAQLPSLNIADFKFHVYNQFNDVVFTFRFRRKESEKNNLHELSSLIQQQKILYYLYFLF